MLLTAAETPLAASGSSSCIINNASSASVVADESMESSSRDVASEDSRQDFEDEFGRSETNTYHGWFTHRRLLTALRYLCILFISSCLNNN